MNASDALTFALKARRVIAVISIVAGAAGYKFGPSIWHKLSPHTAPVTVAGMATNSVAGGLGPKNLGEITLTNHYETAVNLGHGKNCLVLPKVIDSHNVQLTLSLESLTPNGAIHDLTVTQITAKTGKPMDVAVGDFQFSMTPKMISE